MRAHSVQLRYHPLFLGRLIGNSAATQRNRDASVMSCFVLFILQVEQYRNVANSKRATIFVVSANERPGSPRHLRTVLPSRITSHWAWGVGSVFGNGKECFLNREALLDGQISV